MFFTFLAYLFEVLELICDSLRFRLKLQQLLRFIVENEYNDACPKRTLVLRLKLSL